MAPSRLRGLLLIGCALCGAPLAGCTSTADMSSTLATENLALTSEPDPALPDEVSVYPYPASAAADLKLALAASPEVTKPESAAATVDLVTPAAYARIDAPQERLGPQSVEARSPELDSLIARYSDHYGVPEDLVRRVVKRESNFRPEAKNGPYLGLMQIRHDTARGMGYDGPAGGLLDAETNLKYAVKYLRGAWLVAGGDPDRSVRLYSRGYYYDAKRKGLLETVGMKGPRRLIQ